MDPQCYNSSTLSCELHIIRAKNIDTTYTRDLFIRCYLSAGNNTRVRLDTKTIPSSNSNVIWNQTFSLDCLGTQNSIKQLKHGLVIFELRSKRTTPLIGRINGSKLLGRAEIPWQDVFESKSLQIKKWVIMESEKTSNDDLKLPAVELGMRIRESFNGRRLDQYHEDCDCKDCQRNLCHVDYDF